MGLLSLPAASMDGGVFYGAAHDAGLPTDNNTLNEIVRRVNDGMTPQAAAQAVKQSSARAQTKGGSMGLLDFMGSSVDDPKTAATLALAQGLLGGRSGMTGLLGGMQGYVGTMEEAKQRALKEQMVKAQLDDIAQQAALRKAQATKANNAMDMASRLMGGGQQGAAPVPQGGGTPSSPPTVPQTGGMGGVQGQQSPASFLSRLNEDQITGLIASGALPEKAYDIWKFSKVGEQMQPGYQRMPDGRLIYNPDPTKGLTLGPNGQVQAMPGAAAAQAEIAGATAGATTGAQEKAKAPYTLVDGYDPASGRPIKVPLSQVVGQTAREPMTPNGAVVPSTPAEVSRAEADVRKLADSVRPKAPQVPGFAAGASSTEKAANVARDDLNKNWIDKIYTPTLQSGEAAQNMLTSIQTARQGLAMAGSGWGKSAQVSGAKVLAALGVPQAENLATGAQVFQQAASTRLWEVLNDAKGPQTEGDASRAQQTFAQLGNTPRANQFLLDLAQAKAERDSIRAKWFRDAVPIAQKEGDLTIIDRKWQEREPSIYSMPSMRKWAQ